MNVSFDLQWKTFKQKPAAELFSEYVNQISKFSSGGSKKGNAKEKVWVCDRSGKTLSSEALAEQVEKIRDSGSRHLRVILGGPDGFSKDGLSKLNLDFIWSFGPMTLPHELAAVIAAEQIYRALTILGRLPYHTKH